MTLERSAAPHVHFIDAHALFYGAHLALAASYTLVEPPSPPGERYDVEQEEELERLAKLYSSEFGDEVERFVKELESAGTATERPLHLVVVWDRPADSKRFPFLLNVLKRLEHARRDAIRSRLRLQLNRIYHKDGDDFRHNRLRRAPLFGGQHAAHVPRASFPKARKLATRLAPFRGASCLDKTTLVGENEYLKDLSTTDALPVEPQHVIAHVDGDAAIGRMAAGVQRLPAGARPSSSSVTTIDTDFLFFNEVAEVRFVLMPIVGASDDAGLFAVIDRAVLDGDLEWGLCGVEEHTFAAVAAGHDFSKTSRSNGLAGFGLSKIRTAMSKRDRIAKPRPTFIELLGACGVVYNAKHHSLLQLAYTCLLDKIDALPAELEAALLAMDLSLAGELEYSRTHAHLLQAAADAEFDALYPHQARGLCYHVAPRLRDQAEIDRRDAEKLATAAVKTPRAREHGTAADVRPADQQRLEARTPLRQRLQTPAQQPTVERTRDPVSTPEVGKPFDQRGKLQSDGSWKPWPPGDGGGGDKKRKGGAPTMAANKKATKRGIGELVKEKPEGIGKTRAKKLGAREGTSAASTSAAADVGTAIDVDAPVASTSQLPAAPQVLAGVARSDEAVEAEAAVARAVAEAFGAFANPDADRAAAAAEQAPPAPKPDRKGKGKAEPKPAAEPKQRKPSRQPGDRFELVTARRPLKAFARAHSASDFPAADRTWTQVVRLLSAAMRVLYPTLVRFWHLYLSRLAALPRRPSWAYDADQLVDRIVTAVPLLREVDVSPSTLTPQQQQDLQRAVTDWASSAGIPCAPGDVDLDDAALASVLQERVSELRAGDGHAFDTCMLQAAIQLRREARAPARPGVVRFPLLPAFASPRLFKVTAEGVVTNATTSARLHWVPLLRRYTLALVRPLVVEARRVHHAKATHTTLTAIADGLALDIARAQLNPVASPTLSSALDELCRTVSHNMPEQILEVLKAEIHALIVACPEGHEETLAVSTAADIFAGRVSGLAPTSLYLWQHQLACIDQQRRLGFDPNHSWGVGLRPDRAQRRTTFAFDSGGSLDLFVGMDAIAQTCCTYLQRHAPDMLEGSGIAAGIVVDQAWLQRSARLHAHATHHLDVPRISRDQCRGLVLNLLDDVCRTDTLPAHHLWHGAFRSDGRDIWLTSRSAWRGFVDDDDYGDGDPLTVFMRTFSVKTEFFDAAKAAKVRRCTEFRLKPDVRHYVDESSVEEVDYVPTISPATMVEHKARANQRQQLPPPPASTAYHDLDGPAPPTKITLKQCSSRLDLLHRRAERTGRRFDRSWNVKREAGQVGGLPTSLRWLGPATHGETMARLGAHLEAYGAVADSSDTSGLGPLACTRLAIDPGLSTVASMALAVRDDAGQDVLRHLELGPGTLRTIQRRANAEQSALRNGHGRRIRDEHLKRQLREPDVEPLSAAELLRAINLAVRADHRADAIRQRTRDAVEAFWSRALVAILQNAGLVGQRQLGRSDGLTPPSHFVETPAPPLVYGFGDGRFTGKGQHAVAYASELGRRLHRTELTSGLPIVGVRLSEYLTSGNCSNRACRSARSTVEHVVHPLRVAGRTECLRTALCLNCARALDRDDAGSINLLEVLEHQLLFVGAHPFKEA